MRDTGTPMLTSTSQYEILYGGIDNDQITKRATDATQMMHNIARYMSDPDGVLLSLSRLLVHQCG